MNDTETDLELIAGAVDSNGDEVPQDHPIENPGDDGEGSGDPVDEPHPDEPGAPEGGEEPPSKPDDG
jgi:hypothetical protein